MPELAKLSLNTTFFNEEVLVELEDFKKKLLSVTKQSWYKGSEIRSVRLANQRKEKLGNRQLDILARQNFSRYRKMTDMILDSVEQCIRELSGLERLQPSCSAITRDIEAQIVPEIWRQSGKCYNSNLNYKSWQNDFLGRLSFINTWYITKYESKASKNDGLIFYDMSKLFNSQDLIQGIIKSSF